jgi:hypothetical protein
MRVRHRIPSVFSLSMVDVMCCALGCVILLWLLNLKNGKDKIAAADVEIANRKDEVARLELDVAQRKAAVAKLEEESSDLKGSLAQRSARILYLNEKVRKEEMRSADLENRVTAGNKRISDLELERTALTKKEGELTVNLTANEKRVLELLAKLEVSEKKVKNLEPLTERVPMLAAQLKAAELRLTELQKESDGRATRLDEALRGASDLRAERGALELSLKQRSDELTAARMFENRWKTAQDDLTQLRKDLAAGKLVVARATSDLEDLKAQKRVLDTEIYRIRQAADNRFAGITLTGRRVVFLIDMSGSMELVDEKTPAPDKWPSVRNSLVKVMKSLPDLEKFQVVVFSQEARFLLGNNGQWIDYDEKTSPKRVEEALAATKPAGGTNMYAALDAAFRYRAFGLDTIYLFSDGLPNMGEGVPTEEAERLLRANREPELSERLSKHIRQQLRRTWNPPGEKERVRINSIGFFYESPDVGAFLWALSRENDGSFVGMSKP